VVYISGRSQRCALFTVPSYFTGPSRLDAETNDELVASSEAPEDQEMNKDDELGEESTESRSTEALHQYQDVEDQEMKLYEVEKEDKDAVQAGGTD